MAKVHLVLPAAGIGKRFGLGIPKQYCEINGKTVFEWTLAAFANIDLIEQRIVVVQAEDLRAISILKNFPMYQQVFGGDERSNSVFNGLKALNQTESMDDWILVHDVARPCIRLNDILKLINQCESTGIGGVLGRPLTDTIKQRNGKDQWKTIDRTTLWSVQTPQCFRLGDILSAYDFCAQNKIPVTDEASAIEATNVAVQLIEGSSDNIKLTHAEDASLIGHYLNQQNR